MGLLLPLYFCCLLMYGWDFWCCGCLDCSILYAYYFIVWIAWMMPSLLKSGTEKDVCHDVTFFVATDYWKVWMHLYISLLFGISIKVYTAGNWCVIAMHFCLSTQVFTIFYLTLIIFHYEIILWRFFFISGQSDCSQMMWCKDRLHSPVGNNPIRAYSTTIIIYCIRKLNLTCCISGQFADGWQTWSYYWYPGTSFTSEIYYIGILFMMINIPPI